MDKLKIKLKSSGRISGDFKPQGNVKGDIHVPDRVYVRELSFSTYLEFPSVGDPLMLYIATDENAMYRFDEDEMSYIPLGLQTDDIDLINGGNANA